MLLKLKKNKKGFTLIELIVVVAILAILAAIAVPSFIGLTGKAKAGVDIANASAIAGVINTYNAMQSDTTKWYKGDAAHKADWAGMQAIAGLSPMLPVISANSGNGTAVACGLVTVDPATGVATVTTTGVS